PLSFPQKLWVLVESDQIMSIWWSHGGHRIVIDQEMFKVEVLGMKGRLKVFEMENMKSFFRQLNLYGFTKIPRDHERSPSLPEFLAEEEALVAHRKVLVYYHLFFKRDYPQLLEHCKRR
ncbi:HSFY1 protein, partial [Penelope pileata]|nr:HSFY1 protein [Penelope pileata]